MDLAELQTNSRYAAEPLRGRPREAGPVERLVEDVRIVASAIFADVRDARRIIAAMCACANELRSLRSPQPRHRAWIRAALIVQLLICSADCADAAATRGAVARLSAFLEENADLLDQSVSAERR